MGADNARPLPRIWNIPHIQNRNFTGRDELLHALRSELASGRPAALTQAIHGLGGVGKTQTAVEYAYRHQTGYDIVWWVRSEETATLAADYAALAAELGLPEKGEPQQNLIVKAVRHWLGQNPGWLLIFDNATDRANIRDYLPQSTTGHVIVTSRNANWQGVAHPLNVKVLERDDSIKFLLKRTEQDDRETAAKIAELLGHLPLALEQAGAYIQETGSTLAGYLDLLEPYLPRLMQRGTTATDYQATVATTWDISFQQVKEASPAAEDLMNLCAFFAPDAIPLKIISDGAEYLPETLADAVTDPLTLDETVAALRRYSLAEVENDAISFHRLVQAVLRERLNEDAKKQWAEAAVQIVVKAFPFDSGDVRTWSECSSLLTHGLAVTEHAGILNVAYDNAGNILSRIGLYLRGRAELAGARTVLENGLIFAEKAFDEANPNLAKAINNLGLVLDDQGDLTGAQAHYEHAIALIEALQDKHHPALINFTNNLGALLRKQGDLTGAREQLERSLAIGEANYGKEDSRLAPTINNLGVVLGMQGDLEGERAYHERSLAIAKSTYGANHPWTASYLYNLAIILAQQGNLTDARAHIEYALKIFREFLGEEHPTTAQVRRNLAAIVALHGENHSE